MAWKFLSVGGYGDVMFQILAWYFFDFLVHSFSHLVAVAGGMSGT